MELEINKSEKYVVISTQAEIIDDIISSSIEKTIAKIYASEGMINFILELKNATSISQNGLTLLSKVQKICQNESGLWVLVSTNNDLIDEISAKSVEYVLILPTIEEAIDAVFMNELENEFRDEQNEDEFGSENDY